MRVAATIRAGIGALLLVQLGTTFAAVALFARMSPTIDRLRGTNLIAFQGAEEMLSLVARVECDRGAADLDPAMRELIDSARARSSSGEGENRLVSIENHWRRLETARCDSQSINELVRAIRDYSGVNRSRLQATTQEARRQISAGAWVTVLLGLFSFLLSILVLRRFQAEVLDPIDEVGSVIRAAIAGDPLRRCAPVRAATEFQSITENLNLALDDRLKDRLEIARSLRSPRGALNSQLLEMLPAPVLILKVDGSILVANRAAMALLNGEKGEILRGAMVTLPERHLHGTPEWLSVQERDGEPGWICTINSEIP